MQVLPRALKIPSPGALMELLSLELVSLFELVLGLGQRWLAQATK